MSKRPNGEKLVDDKDHCRRLSDADKAQAEATMRLGVNPCQDLYVKVARMQKVLSRISEWEIRGYSIREAYESSYREDWPIQTTNSDTSQTGDGMIEQPKALWLADGLEDAYPNVYTGLAQSSAAELRRLHALCEEMGEALERVLSVYSVSHSPETRKSCWDQVRAAIAKWKESK